MKILTKKSFDALAAETTFSSDARLGTSDQTLRVPDSAVQPSQTDKPMAAARLADASAAGNNDYSTAAAKARKEINCSGDYYA